MAATHMVFQQLMTRTGVWEHKDDLSELVRLCLKKKGDKEKEDYSHNISPCYLDEKCRLECMRKLIS